MSFVLFLVVSLGTLLGSHYLFFATTVRFLNITNPTARLSFFVAVSVLALSFFLSAIFARLSSNPLTDTFSWVASVWLGLLLHLLGAIALIWLTRWLSSALGLSVNMKLVCLSLYAIAAGVTAYGVFNSMVVRTRHLEVEIESLPDRWRGSTIVQLSDVHLGSIRGLRFLDAVIEKVNALDPDLVLITGDLFDGMGGRLDSFAAPLSQIRAAEGVYFVSGNHEGYLGLTAPLSVVEKAGIRILDDEVVDAHGLQLVGVSFPEFGMLNKRLSVERMAADIDPNKPSILLYHTPTDVGASSSDRATQQSSTYLSPDIDFAFARQNGIDLQLSGHTHQGQIFPFTHLTKMIFSGYHYGLHEIGGLRVYISSGTGTWGPPLRTGSVSEIVALRLR